MARPVPRRRSERDAPDAGEYTSRRRGRSEEPADDEDTTERRPRRGRARGELPTRGRRSAPDATQEGTPIPTSREEVDSLDDEAWDDLVHHFDLDADEADEAALWKAIQATQEPDEEPAPRRGRRGRSEPADEPDEAPRGRRGRRAAADEDDEPPARGRRGRRSKDDDEDEAPQRTARRGFEAFKETRKAIGGFDDDFKLSEDEVLVKFLEDEPFAVYGEHGLYKELKEGQRVWNCLAPDDDCPIDATGHRPRAVGLWNIVVIPEEGEPQLKVLKAGPKLNGILEKKNGLKTGPLSKEYYSLSQTAGKNDGPVEYMVELVRERDLKAEWQTEPLTDEELEEFEEQMHDETFVKYPTKAQLKEIARKLRDSD